MSSLLPAEPTYILLDRERLAQEGSLLANLSDRRNKRREQLGQLISVAVDERLFTALLRSCIINLLPADIKHPTHHLHDTRDCCLYTSVQVNRMIMMGATAGEKELYLKLGHIDGHSLFGHGREGMLLLDC